MKVFLHKITKEYGHYLGRGEFATSSIPQIFPDTMDIDTFKKYVMDQEGCKLNVDDYTIKNIEITILD